MSTMVAVEHPDSVLEWRIEEFKRMGFEQAAATFLAYTRADLHDMALLLEKGCPHNLAIRIMNDQDEDF
jgi:hypothetical protein